MELHAPGPRAAERSMGSPLVATIEHYPLSARDSGGLLGSGQRLWMPGAASKRGQLLCKLLLLRLRGEQ